QLVISGPTTYDDLGRSVSQRYPFTVASSGLGVFQSLPNPQSAVPATQTDWNLRDQVTQVTEPNGTVTKTAYGFGGQTDFGASLFTRTETDALGKANRL